MARPSNSFPGLLSSRKTTIGLLGFAAGSVVLQSVIQSLCGQTAGQGLETAGPMMGVGGVLTVKLFDAVANFWANHRTSEHASEVGKFEAKLNHDVERLVARTLRELIEASDEYSVHPEALRPLARLFADERPLNTPARWVKVSEKLGVEFDRDLLVHSSLRRVVEPARMAQLAEGFADLFAALCPRTAMVHRVHDAAAMFRRLGVQVATEFAGRFHQRLKESVTTHPTAWVAMQLEIGESLREIAQRTYDAVVAVDARVAADGARLLALMQVAVRAEDALARLLTAQSIREAGRDHMLAQQLDRLRRDLEERRLVPPIALPVQPADPESPARLHFAARNGELIGRDLEMDELLQFLHASPDSNGLWTQFSWWMWTAPGGTGKSRLALEAGLRAREEFGWDAGFFDHSLHQRFAVDAWMAWNPHTPTVIIIDNASDTLEPIMAMLVALHRRQASLEHPVRVLLLDREHAAIRIEEYVRGRPEMQNALRGAAYRGADPVHWTRSLAGLPEEAMLNMIERELSTTTTTEFRREAARALLRRTDIQGRRMLPEGNTLVAAVLAAALRASGYAALQDATAEVLIRTIVAQEIEKWRAAGVNGRHLNLLFAATLLRRELIVDQDDPAYMALAPLLPSPESLNVHHCALLSSFSGRVRTREDSVLPLEPDLLGELFVLERFSGSFSGNDESNPQSIKKTSDGIIGTLAAVAGIDALAGCMVGVADELPGHAAALALVLSVATPAQAEASVWLLGIVRDSFSRWGQLDSAYKCAEQMVAVARQMPSSVNDAQQRRSLAYALGHFALSASQVARYEESDTYFEEALGVRRSLVTASSLDGELADLCVLLSNYAYSIAMRGEFSRSRKHYEESLSFREAIAEQQQTVAAAREFALALFNVGHSLGQERLFDAALPLLNRSLLMLAKVAELVPTSDSLEALANVWGTLAQVHLSRGDSISANTASEHCLVQRHQLAVLLGTYDARRAHCVALSLRARVKSAQSETDEARKLLLDAEAGLKKLAKTAATFDVVANQVFVHMEFAAFDIVAGDRAAADRRYGECLALLPDALLEELSLSQLDLRARVLVRRMDLHVGVDGSEAVKWASAIVETCAEWYRQTGELGELRRLSGAHEELARKLADVKNFEAADGQWYISAQLRFSIAETSDKTDDYRSLCSCLGEALQNAILAKKFAGAVQIARAAVENRRLLHERLGSADTLVMLTSEVFSLAALSDDDDERESLVSELERVLALYRSVYERAGVAESWSEKLALLRRSAAPADDVSQHE